MPYLWDRIGRLLASTVLLAALTLVSCTGDNTVPAAASNVNNLSFVFPNGVIFDPALSNLSTSLTFTNNAATFLLQATVQGSSRQASGSNMFGSCVLTIGASTDPAAVGGGSDFPVGQGPPPGAVITFNLCDLNLETKTLMVSNGAATALSLPATPVTGTSGSLP